MFPECKNIPVDGDVSIKLKLFCVNILEIFNDIL